MRSIKAKWVALALGLCAVAGLSSAGVRASDTYNAGEGWLARTRSRIDNSSLDEREADQFREIPEQDDNKPLIDDMSVSVIQNRDFLDEGTFGEELADMIKQKIEQGNQDISSKKQQIYDMIKQKIEQGNQDISSKKQQIYDTIEDIFKQEIDNFKFTVSSRVQRKIQDIRNSRPMLIRGGNPNGIMELYLFNQQGQQPIPVQNPVQPNQQRINLQPFNPPQLQVMGDRIYFNPGNQVPNNQQGQQPIPVPPNQQPINQQPFNPPQLQAIGDRIYFNPGNQVPNNQQGQQPIPVQNPVQPNRQRIQVPNAQVPNAQVPNAQGQQQPIPVVNPNAPVEGGPNVQGPNVQGQVPQP